jgi:hypothetical protein
VAGAVTLFSKLAGNHVWQTVQQAGEYQDTGDTAFLSPPESA